MLIINYKNYAICLKLDCVSFPSNIGKATILKGSKESRPMKVALLDSKSDFAISLDNKDGQIYNEKRGSITITPTLLQRRAILNYLNNKVYDEFKSLYFEPLMTQIFVHLHAN